MENRVRNAGPQGLPRLDWTHQSSQDKGSPSAIMSSLCKAWPIPGALQRNAILPRQQDSLEENELLKKEQLACLTRSRWLHGRLHGRIIMDRAFLNLQQPSPTGLEGLEAVSSVQKVLQWLEVYVPSDPGTLAKEDEDSENKTDKGQFREILEEDMPSDTYEERSGSQGVSEDFSDQELFQWEQDENKAAKGKRISPPLAASRHTKDKPAMSSRYQREIASVTTATSVSQAASTPTWETAPVPRVQRRAHLQPSHPPADKSPPLTATHSPVQQQRPSLLRRALRAVCRVFLGTRRPREQQSPAPSARQLPGEGCSEHQQRPLRE